MENTMEGYYMNSAQSPVELFNAVGVSDKRPMERCSNPENSTKSWTRKFNARVKS